MTAPNSPKIEWVDICASTNTLLAGRSEAPGGTVVAAVSQTAGRGQRGNSWEAEPGRNLTFSMLLRPAGIPAARQFELSMLVSLAIVERLDSLVPDISIKWPNDIYAGDRKLAGILIENTLSGSRIERSVVGVGLNVNQAAFLSDAPNPVSLVQLTGRELSLTALLGDICGDIAREIDGYDGDSERLLRRYMPRLWRSQGRHTFVDTASGLPFEASIESVAPAGPITLLADDGPRTYAFKEVSFQL